MLITKKTWNCWAENTAQRPNVYFTTLIYLYALPTDFPGHAQSLHISDCYQKVAHLEAKISELATELGLGENFIPHVELHEFETLILVEPEALKIIFLEDQPAIKRLTDDIASFRNVEEINHTPHGAPSKRIAHHSKVYGKYKRAEKNGVIDIIQHIGLAKLRKCCKHFDQWISCLENLAI